MFAKSGKYLALFLAVSGALQAQPFMFPRGIVNAASLLPPGLPNGAIARGSVFSIFGRNLGPAAAAQASAFPLQTTLAGVSIRVTQGTTTVEAIPVFVRGDQINAILPSNTPLGMVSVRVTMNNLTSNPLPLRVAASGFGIVAANSGGYGPGVVQNFVTSEVQPVNSLTTTARGGQIITLWGTGLGAALNADNQPPQPGNLPTRLEVMVGGKQARVLYSGRSPCCSGTDQIVFEVPGDAPAGCWVPVQVVTDGSVTSNTVTMAIHPEGQACTEPSNPAGAALARGGKLGIFALVRSVLRQEVMVPQPGDVTSDTMTVQFREERGGQFAFNPMLSLPPQGTCTAFGTAGNLLGPEDSFAALLPSGRFLDGGTSVTVIGPGGARQPRAPRNGRVLVASLGGALGTYSGFPSSLFLQPGGYQIQAGGGAEVGAARASFDVPMPFTWSNRGQLATVDRSRELELTWTGVPSTHSIIVLGASADLPVNVTGIFACAAPQGATQFRVPPYILRTLPAGRQNLTKSIGHLYLLAAPVNDPARMQATGLDAGFAFGLHMQGRTVAYR